ncbi:cytochrome c1 [Sulfitobacter dubius]|uniref:Cytochrome c1 n=1 Tax=Sulfitobacter dubius TaxID=218673 RepID=A0ABY3ZHY6_9RHOB|nr:cytochrome c1 [Sulfitobacter dubius]UOA13424.1 Cytochrome c1 [Sulfitobacter dubius]
MMKTNLLSAVVSLGLALPGTAVLAQDTATEEELLTTPAETPETEAETAPAEAPAAEEAPAEAEATEAEPEVEAAPADEPAAEEAPAEEPTTAEAPAEEAPDEEVTPEEAPAEEAASEEAPAETVATEEAPAADEAVTEEAPAEEAAEEETTEEAPAEDATEEVSEEDAAEAPAEEVEATDEVQSTAEENAENDVIAEDDVDGQAHIDNIDFSFDGPFGGYDVNQLQRGLQIYTEVCAACHGLEYVAMRTLADESGPNMPEDQVIEYAKGYDVYDAELDDTRPGTPVDHFPGSNLPNAPDLSLMAKKRAAFHGPYGLGINQFLKGIGGPEYITALLTGYTGEEKEQAGTVLYENTVFPGGWIAMAPPLSDELVEFADEHANDVQHMAEDVSAFLMWTAEPKLGARKQAGFAGVVLLGLLSVLLYLTNKKLWAPVKNRRKDD